MKRRSQRGFTMIELMVSLVLFSLVIAGMLSIAVTMAQAFREQQLTVSAEDASRAAIEYLSDAVRSASPGVPSGNIEHVNTCTVGSFKVRNFNNQPDELTLTYAPGPLTTLTNNYGVGTVAIDVVDGTQFKVGDSVLITNFTNGHIAEVITGSTFTKPGTLLLQAQTCGAFTNVPNYTPGASVLRVVRARFFIEIHDGVTTLMMDPDDDGPAPREPLAEGIEDMQVAVGFDTGVPGLLENGAAGDDDEWLYNHPSDTQPLQPPAAGATGLPAVGAVRAIRITLIATATVPVPAAIYLRPAAGDRAVAAGPDGFRRRVLNSIVEVRNLGGSP